MVANDFGTLGKAYVETDIAEADRETIIRNFILGTRDLYRRPKTQMNPPVYDNFHGIGRLEPTWRTKR